MVLQPPPPGLPSVADAREAAQLLRAGRLVAHPTESLLGVAADPESEIALNALDALKTRSGERGYVMVAARIDHCRGWIADDSPGWQVLGYAWSGPVTVVAPAGKRAVRRVCGAGDTVAVRLDRHPATVALGAELRHPWVSTSLNLPGQPPARTWQDVPPELARHLAGVLHIPPAPRGLASTLVALRDGTVVILRPGPVSADELTAGLRALGLTLRGPSDA